MRADLLSRGVAEFKTGNEHKYLILTREMCCLATSRINKRHDWST